MIDPVDPNTQPSRALSVSPPARDQSYDSPFRCAHLNVQSLGERLHAARPADASNQGQITFSKALRALSGTQLNRRQNPQTSRFVAKDLIGAKFYPILSGIC
ncbi:MAG: hypothetical protein AAGH74_02250 [Pseudomonadota bacterium]